MHFAPAPTALPDLDKRQGGLWGHASATSPSASSCPSVTLAAGGILTLNPTSTLTFATNLIFQPNCEATNAYCYSGNSAVEDNKEPFYASTTVLIYVVATATVIAWLLLTLLLIAPGHHGQKAASKPSAWLGGRGVSSVLSTGPSIVQYSSRPWLQKAAAFLVTVALTIASADIFKIAAQQYNMGYMSAEEMRDDVVGSLSIRIMRVVSDVFISLAQVQTLIRLFPRRKEKLIIKWFGFLLILLDTVFSCLDSFYVDSKELPRWYSDAIPALSYLFQLSISLLYGAWVFYYVATKRRYAFFNRDMPNITIVSLLSIVSILIPVGFFVADVSVPVVAGWGDFFRWVGAAAASILVWEWVERIEFLEREEKKSGILGREIFEEDEMFDGDSSTKRSGSRIRDLPFAEESHTSSIALGNFMQALARLNPRKQVRSRASPKNPQPHEPGADEVHMQVETIHRYPAGQMPTSILSVPPHSDTPVSRTDTDTPSTVYAVHYHPVTTTPPVSGESSQQLGQIAESATTTSSTQVESAQGSAVHVKSGTLTLRDSSSSVRPRNVRRGVQYATHIFKRGKRSPPLEIKQAMSLNARTIPQNNYDGHRRAVKRRLGRIVGLGDTEERLPSDTLEEPTVIPAPPRGHAWSPDMMRHNPVELRGTRERLAVISLDDALAQAPEEDRSKEAATKAANTHEGDNSVDDTGVTEGNTASTMQADDATDTEGVGGPSRSFYFSGRPPDEAESNRIIRHMGR